jgi:hypothetical protein
MLRIDVPLTPEGWDEENEVFVEPKYKTLQLEHSLVSLSKWESKWLKPFLSQDTRTDEEMIDYIRCMTITQNVDPEVYEKLSNQNIIDVNEYINAPMTATWFSKNEKRKHKTNSGKQVTSELIYYWMIAFNIPSDYQKWHLNRLLTLINVCEAENQPSKPMSKRDVRDQYRSLNASRRKNAKMKG